MMLLPRRLVCSLILLVCADVNLATGEEYYAGRPYSYWRKEIHKPNPSWSDPPFLFHLRKTPDSETIPLLLALLRDSDSETRGLAAACLGSLGQRGKNAIPNLNIALQDPAPFVRWNAACALGRVGLGEVKAHLALRKVLRDPDKRVRLNAALALWTTTQEPQPSVDTLIGLLRNAGPSDDIFNVYKVLRHIGPKAIDAVPFLIHELDHNRVNERRAFAAEALGYIGPSAHIAISSLCRALHTSDDCIRIHAARSIWMISKDGSQSLPVIIALAHSDNAGIYVRKLAIQLLGELKSRHPEAIRALTQIQDDSDLEIRAAVRHAMRN